MTGRIMRIVATVGFVLAFTVIATGTAQADDETRPAEFAVLDRWLGEWDLEMTVKPSRQNPQGHKALYKSSVRWSLNNRFLRCEAKGEGMDGDLKVAEEFMWIITFDREAKRYSSTVFWSNAIPGTTGAWGAGPFGIGTWDEKEQMLTIRAEDKETGMVTLSVTQWIDKDNHRWVQSMTEKNGNVVIEMTGVGKRRK